MPALQKGVLNEKFRIDKTADHKTRIIAFHGVIDEDADFSAIPVDREILVFKFRGVTMINSCGVRNWVNALKALSANGRRVVFAECPPVIVRQMNMVPSFLGKAHVESVLVPFICGNCDTERLELLAGGALSDVKARVARKMPCMSCAKGEMEFEESPDDYFAFLR